jgi:copper-containing nitrite reductase
VNLTNLDTAVLHNVDFHGVTGPGGGAKVTTSEAPEVRSAEFKLLYPGLYIYHCAVEPVGVHVANGMYGLLLVEPEGGLPKVDKEFYVLQSEFYTTPTVDNPRLLELDQEAALREQPTHVVLNGRDGSMKEEGMLRAQTGDRVRVYFGNAGPNLVSSFHIIGTIFDKVYREGDLISSPARGLQTTLVPAGGAAVIEVDLPVPGVFTMVDHSIWRIEKGCVGFIGVEGETRPDIFYATGSPLTCANCKIHP